MISLVLWIRFFIGLDELYYAHQLKRVFISVNRCRRRKSDFKVHDWIMDSGAFTEIATHGEYRQPASEYVGQIRRWQRCGNLLAAVSQDYMCEPFILAKTGCTVAEHQAKTIARFDEIAALSPGVPIIPVLQGFEPQEYVAHLRAYGSRISPGDWVGVGSVCKRNSNPREIKKVLMAIKIESPRLRLHGFGIKKTSLKSGTVRRLLYSSDSMAWSFNARRNGLNAHDPQVALAYVRAIETQEVQDDFI